MGRHAVVEFMIEIMCSLYVKVSLVSWSPLDLTSRLWSRCEWRLNQWNLLCGYCPGEKVKRARLKSRAVRLTCKTIESCSSKLKLCSHLSHCRARVCFIVQCSIHHVLEIYNLYFSALCSFLCEKLPSLSLISSLYSIFSIHCSKPSVSTLFFPLDHYVVSFSLLIQMMNWRK